MLLAWFFKPRLCVPLNYAFMLLTGIFKPRLCVLWIMTLCYSPDVLTLDYVCSIELCPYVVHMIFKIYIKCFILNYVPSFFVLFCKFRSFVFHWIMPFLFSLEFPKLPYVLLNYAYILLARFFKPRLCVFNWIISFLYHLIFLNQHHVHPLELCTSLVNKVGRPLHSFRQGTKL